MHRGEANGGYAVGAVAVRLGVLVLWLWALPGCGAQAGVASVGRGEHATADALGGPELYAAGMGFLASSDLIRAEQYLASALRMGFDERACVRALLEATLRASRLRSALTYAEPALVHQPNDVLLRQLVATIHLVLGELPQAERELRKVLALRETQAEAHYLLSLVLARAGAEERSRLVPLRRYLELAPEGAHAEEVRANLHEIEAQTTVSLQDGA